MITNIVIRRILYSDAKLVSIIDRSAYEEKYWDSLSFLKRIKDVKYHGFVATINELVCGYVMYRYSNEVIVVTRLATDPILKRQGIGGSLLNKVEEKLDNKYKQILLVIRDTNLSAHLFLKNQNYKALEVKRKFFNDSDIKDGYVFSYIIEEK